MDINVVREVVMVVGLVAFLSIVWWAYAPSRRNRFERDGLSVFDDDARDARQGTARQPERGE